MTEQSLKKRLLELDAQRKQMEANLNAIAGAMQECQYWLNAIPTANSSVEEEIKK
jgi:prefoldin subunit 5